MDSELEQMAQAMQLAKQGDWEGAHQIAQDSDSPEAAWVHAYLHRQEGDDGNAAYWYRRAEKPFPQLSLAEEWDQIYQALTS